MRTLMENNSSDSVDLIERVRRASGKPVEHIVQSDASAPAVQRDAGASVA